jgi:hypothetical protein
MPVELGPAWIIEKSNGHKTLISKHGIFTHFYAVIPPMATLSVYDKDMELCVQVTGLSGLHEWHGELSVPLEAPAYVSVSGLKGRTYTCVLRQFRCLQGEY